MLFHPIVEEWFRRTLGSPTPAQENAWKELAAGNDVLVSAPTGSGKTLAAFLLCDSKRHRLTVGTIPGEF